MDQLQLYSDLLYAVSILSLIFAGLGARFRQTLFYAVAYMLPILWMIPTLIVPRAPSMPWAWYAWLLVLLFIVWMVYVLRGSHRGWYSEVIQPRRSVWITFGAIVLLTLLAVSSGYFNVKDRTHGLNVMSQHLRNALTDTVVKAEELSHETAKLQKKVNEDGGVATEQEKTVLVQYAKYVGWQATIVISMTNAYSATLSLDNAATGLEQEQNGTQLSLPTVEAMQRTHNLDAARTILTIAEAIRVHQSNIKPTLILKDIVFQVEEIADLSNALQRTAPVFDTWDPIPVILVLSLFVLFLLMPWLLYLSFILSKRSTTVRDRRTTLRDLEIEDRFVNSSTSLIPDERGIAKEVANYLLTAERILRGKELSKERKEEEVLDELNKALGKLSIDVDAGAGAENERRKSTLLNSTDLVSLEHHINDAKKTIHLRNVQTATDLAIDILVKQRRFHSREYIVPLLILTLLTLIGWYYIVMPNTVRGLIEFVDQGSSLAAFTNMFTGYFTPVTMAFAGAWLFIIIMLTHRWVTSDLYPKSYFYSAVRLVTAFVIGLVFTAISKSVQGSADWLILPLAFAVGASPIEWIRAMWRALGRVGSSVKNILRDNKISNLFWGEAVQEFKPRDWGSRHELTELDDITIWDDTRLHQEGVNNVHALATVDLDRLIISTPYDAQTLIDWVDQALLFIHTKDLWRPGLAAIGIRNATNFLNYAWNDDVDEFKPSAILSVAKAYNHASAASERPEDPRNKACNSASELLSSAAELVASQETVSKTADQLDNIKALQENLEELNGIAAAAQDMRQEVLNMLDGLQSGGPKLDDAKEAWQDQQGVGPDANLADKLQEIEDMVEAAQVTAKEDKLSRLQLRAQNNGDALIALGETQVNISSLDGSVKSELDERASGAKQEFDEAKREFDSAAGKKNVDDKALFDKASAKMEDFLAEIGKLKTSVDNANKRAQALQGNDPQSWDQLKKLRGELGETGLKKATDAIDGLCAASIQNLSALGEFCSVANAVRALQALQQTQKTASKSIKLVLDELAKDSVPDDLVAYKNKLDKALVDTDSLAGETESTAEEILRTLAKTAITPEIIQVMLASMDSDPNILYVRNFWRNRRRSALTR